jgi:hypothetical protein
MRRTVDLQVIAARIGGNRVDGGLIDALGTMEERQVDDERTDTAGVALVDPGRGYVGN